MNEIIKRLDNSVQFLKVDQSIRVDEFVLYPISANTIGINLYSQYQFQENLTREKAIEELELKKIRFTELMCQAELFCDYMKDKTIEYNLCIDNKNTSILIGRIKDGTIETFL